MTSDNKLRQKLKKSFILLIWFRSFKSKIIKQLIKISFCVISLRDKRDLIDLLLCLNLEKVSNVYIFFVQKSDCVTFTKEIPSRVMGSICTRRQRKSYTLSEASSQDLQDLTGVSGMRIVSMINFAIIHLLNHTINTEAVESESEYVITEFVGFAD